MFTNKAPDGTNNLCGKAVAQARKNMKMSQRALADSLQVIGLDIDKNTVQRIEAGKGFVTDIELAAFSNVLDVPIPELLKDHIDYLNTMPIKGTDGE